MTDIVIKTHDITKKYQRSCAVKNIGINVKTGDIYGLVGKNGAGKTTLLKIISGLTVPSSGTLELFGQTSGKGLSKARKRTGCIIEMPSFFPYLSVEKNLEYYRIQRGIAGKKCIHEALELVGLSDTGNKKYRDFSLGMKQRLGLALSLMGSPDLLILDEPINGLDPVGIAQFRELLKRLNKERGITIIISSHILGELSQVATTYGFIDKGVLLEENTAVKIEEKCRQYISLTVDDTGKAAVILENKMGCSEYEVLNNNLIKVYQFIDRSDVLAQTLVSNGVRVFSLIQEGTGLESYFIKMIGGSQND